jgi:nucleoporin SEH1
MASNGFHRFSHGHQDLVLAISYNFYGTRMATASSDHRVKVWDRDDKTGQWTVTDVWTAHDAEVTDVKWNGPFVGTHLATIGEDGFLRVWEEDVNEAANSGRRFKKVSEQLTVTGAPYMSLDFKNIGTETYLAVVTRDGHLSISEPEEQDDLRSWQKLWSDYLCKTPSRTEETGFRVSWHKEKLPAWPAVLAGLDRKSLGLAVSVSDAVRIYWTDKDRRFYVAAVLEGAKGLVRDVSWANGSMRGFDLIATASKDGFVRVYELHTPGTSSLSTSGRVQNTGPMAVATQDPLGKQSRSGIGAGLAGNTRGRKDDNTIAAGAIKQEVKLVAELETHAGAPWRVEWSQLGDMLVSTGDDGTVRLWKKAVDGKWLEATEIDATREP